MSQSGVKNIKEMCAHGKGKGRPGWATQETINTVEDSESTLWFCAVVGRLFADLHDTKIQYGKKLIGMDCWF